jgi:hypothetical protein
MRIGRERVGIRCPSFKLDGRSTLGGDRRSDLREQLPHKGIRILSLAFDCSRTRRNGNRYYRC